MPTHSGPNPSADNSIVFSYDTGDTSNSYRGEPTVNIAADLGLVSVALSSITYIGIENGWKKYGLSGTWSGGTYPYAIALNPVTFTGGLPYCVRATVKTNVPDKFNYFGAEGISYVNEPKNYEGTLTSTLNPDGSYTVTRYNFAYTNTTSQAGYLYTNPVNGAVFNPSTDFVWIKEYQAEQKDHPTQFVNGTRSATQGLLPLLGDTTLNISTVSFDSNAQITFDGTDDFFNIPINFGTVTQYTVEYVAYLGAANKMPIAARTNGNFYKYGDNSWRYVHGGVGDEFYHEISPSISGYIHCVVTYDGSLVKVWRNGYYAGSKASSGTADFSDGFKIGYWAAGGSYAWSGPIPIVKIYNTALSTDQVQQNYRQYKSRFNLS
jgi:hypothetical protein